MSTSAVLSDRYNDNNNYYYPISLRSITYTKHIDIVNQPVKASQLSVLK